MLAIVCTSPQMTRYRQVNLDEVSALEAVLGTKLLSEAERAQLLKIKQLE